MPEEILDRLEAGESPLLISVPHAGTRLPRHLAKHLTPAARTLPDTDWYVDRLYSFASECGAGMLVAVHSRYVVDLNRPPNDEPLYATATTGLVPTLTFAGEPIYLYGLEPDADERARRVSRYWKPYHRVLEAELEAIRTRHGYAVLLDAHSIAGEVPRLFKGVLPALNLGSNGGVSADRELISAADRLLHGSPFPAVLDGRFRGGHITRQYGRPGDGIHALQLEIAQRSYMQEAPPVWDEARAVKLQSVLRELVRLLSRWRPDGR